jgi:hypothetical protein
MNEVDWWGKMMVLAPVCSACGKDFEYVNFGGEDELVMIFKCGCSKDMVLDKEQYSIFESLSNGYAKSIFLSQIISFEYIEFVSKYGQSSKSIDKKKIIDDIDKLLLGVPEAKNKFILWLRVKKNGEI